MAWSGSIPAAGGDGGGAAIADTDALAEGASNLYHTEARVTGNPQVQANKTAAEAADTKADAAATAAANADTKAVAADTKAANAATAAANADTKATNAASVAAAAATAAAADSTPLDDSVTSAKIVNGTITAADMAPGVIPTNYLRDNASDVTTGNTISITPASGRSTLQLFGSEAILDMSTTTGTANKRRIRQIMSGDKISHWCLTDAGGAASSAFPMDVYHGGGVVAGRATGNDPGYGWFNGSGYKVNGVDIDNIFARSTEVVLKTGGVFTGNLESNSGASGTGYLGVKSTVGASLVHIEGIQALVNMRDRSAAAAQQYLSTVYANGAYYSEARNVDGTPSPRSIGWCHHHGNIGATRGGVVVGSTDDTNDEGYGTLNAVNGLWSAGVAVATTSDARLKEDILPLQWSWKGIADISNASANWQWITPDEHPHEPTEGFIAQALEEAGFAQWVITDHPGEDNERKRLDKAAMPMLAQAFVALVDLNNRVTALENA